MNLLRKTALAAAMLLGACVPVLAQGTSLTRNAMQLEINTQLPSCGTNCITAQTLRGVLLDMLASTSAIYHDAVVTLTGVLVIDGIPVKPSVLNFLSYGAIADGTGDNAAAYNTFIAACAASTTRQCYIPAGVYNFTTQPNCITSPLHLYGAGPVASQITRNYNGSGTTGLICVINNPGSGTWIDNLDIIAHSTTTGGSLVSVVAGATAMELVHLSNLWISNDGGNCTHNYGLYVDGTAANGGIIGIREMHVENLAVFGAVSASVYLSGVEGVTWNGGSSYPAGCTTSGPFVVTGTAGVPSNNINIGMASIQNGISLDRATTVHFNIADLGDWAGVSVTNTANVSDTSVFYDAISGTVQANWSGSAAVKSNGIVAGIVGPALGGTGINNGSNTITVTGSSFAVTPATSGVGQWSAGALTGTANPVLGASGTSSSVTYSNGTSGTIQVKPVTGALGSAVLSLPAATDTLVGKATTDTLTNKSIDASEINSGILAIARGGTGVSNTGTLTVSVNTVINSATTGLVAESGGTLAGITLGGDCTFTSPNITCTKVNGVTYPASFTSGGIPYASASGAISSSALLGAGLVVVGGGAGTTPATIANGQLPATATNDQASAGKLGEVMTVASNNASSTVTITNASPGVVSWAANTLTVTAPVNFTTTGGLPTGLTVGTQYYVCSASFVSGTSFAVSTSVTNALAGTCVNTSSAGSGTHTAASSVLSQNGTPVDIGGFALTAGDWGCSGNITYVAAGTTVPTFLGSAFNTTTGTFPTSANNTIGNGRSAFSLNLGTGSTNTIPTSEAHIQLASTTNIFFVSSASFTTSTMTASAAAFCHRIR